MTTSSRDEIRKALFPEPLREDKRFARRGGVHLAAMKLSDADFYELSLLYQHAHMTSRQLDALTLRRFAPQEVQLDVKKAGAFIRSRKRRRRQLFDAGLVGRPDSAKLLFFYEGFDISHYLETLGYAVLNERRRSKGATRDLSWVSKKRNRISTGMLTHQLFLSEFGTCLRLALEDSSHALHSWRQDGKLYEEVAVPRYTWNDTTRPVLHMPDARAVITPRGTQEHHIFYIEADRGSVRLRPTSQREAKSMLHRFGRYIHYRAHERFTVLVVTSSVARMKNMQALLRGHDPWMTQPTDLFWFKVVDYDLGNPVAALTGWETATGEPRELLTTSALHTVTV